MIELERFLAVALDQDPDCIPIFGFPGAPGMSRGCMKKTHQRLHETGMPRHVEHGNVESWYRYWGTTGPIGPDFSMAWGAEGIETTRREEGEYVIIEGEDGSVTRELIDNADTYSMPEYRVYPVRDRDSWEFYKARTTPQQFMSDGDMETNCKWNWCRCSMNAGSTHSTRSKQTTATTSSPCAINSRSSSCSDGSIKASSTRVMTTGSNRKSAMMTED